MMTLYRKIEKAFWFTLTRKIIGNVTALLLPTLLLIAGSAWLLQDLREQLEALGVAQEVPLDQFWMLLLVIGLLAVGTGVFIVLFMRSIFVKPIRDITEVLQAVKDKNGDISAVLPDYTFDEISVIRDGTQLQRVYRATQGHDQPDPYPLGGCCAERGKSTKNGAAGQQLIHCPGTAS